MARIVAWARLDGLLGAYASDREPARCVGDRKPKRGGLCRTGRILYDRGDARGQGCVCAGIAYRGLVGGLALSRAYDPSPLRIRWFARTRFRAE